MYFYTFKILIAAITDPVALITAPIAAMGALITTIDCATAEAHTATPDAPMLCAKEKLDFATTAGSCITAAILPADDSPTNGNNTGTKSKPASVATTIPITPIPVIIPPITKAAILPATTIPAEVNHTNGKSTRAKSAPATMAHIVPIVATRVVNKSFIFSQIKSNQII